MEAHPRSFPGRRPFPSFRSSRHPSPPLSPIPTFLLCYSFFDPSNSLSQAYVRACICKAGCHSNSSFFSGPTFPTKLLRISKSHTKPSTRARLNQLTLGMLFFFSPSPILYYLSPDPHIQPRTSESDHFQPWLCTSVVSFK